MVEAEAAEGEDAADLAEEAEVVEATVAEDVAEAAMVEDAVDMAVGGVGIIRTKKCATPRVPGRHAIHRWNQQINVKI